MSDLLGTVLGPNPPSFALLHRPEAAGPGTIDVLTGTVSHPSGLADLPLPDLAPDGGPRHEVLVVIPYRQIAERGFVCADDGTPLIAMAVRAQQTVTVPEALARIPTPDITLTGGRFDVGDDDYAEIVRRVIKEAIGEGEGANFVIRRDFVTAIDGYAPHHAVALFARLLEVESGAYWTFVIHTPGRTLVGATPERHLTLRGGVATMNPISGTYRYPASGPNLPEVLDFLADRKESDELYMVLDEELKMMSRICEPGVRVLGPRLKEMARLAHTEYYIEGDSAWDIRDILRETMFAPTVTGSPLENACRVIARHEPHGRGYYSGVAALIGRDDSGGRTLDSSILIRTADIDAAGGVRIGVGATLVRHSDPASEVAETRAKAAALLAALQPRNAGLGGHPRVRDALSRRNTSVAGFWLHGRTEPAAVPAGLAGRSALVIDAEDTFTSMLDHQLRALDMRVTVRRHDRRPDLDGHDLVVLGPGPGDPRDAGHPKIAYLRAAAAGLLASGRPFLAVCLSHQVVCDRLGLELRRRPTPNQGVQKEIELFGARERVGFYNTFAAHCATDAIDVPGVGRVEICRDHRTGEVHALLGPHFSTLQFHAESVLTQNGPRVLGTLIERVLRP
ncbi:anthranilate synthase family protein [[Actinomadura] parvosata]|uniref:anthranilate synthase family protein n=1 Tax=[Actinomadura] parvosata TaxID=1955412 RepID=UPI00406BEE78